ncbi:nitroreductase family protein [Peptostreptococcus faecalis]|uniref:nitroreductase family protein n=1 Tax=Peptostreptococcus faecalis TaxID=2045015 RepID=UPI000C79E247|nr:nitroreductase family protein [Peptostreptococcus faecalis]
MDVLECIKSRRSVRKFSDKKLEYDTIKNIIDAAVCAPTAQMREPWGFLVIQDKEELKAISDVAKEGIKKEIDTLPHFKKYEDWFNDPEYNVFYGSENLVVVYGDSDAHWYKEDCCCVADNIMLLANNEGIGTCWIGFSEIILDTPELKEKYNIPQNYKPVASLIMGYMDRTPKPPRRKEALMFSK